MRRYGSLGDLPLGDTRRSVAIGVFDGVHVGHQAVIRLAVERARERGIPAMALTFSPHPIAVLRPELRTTVLTDAALKAQIIARLGVDELLVVPFTRAFARIRAERFAEMLVGPPIGADVIVVGENFRFGHGGKGTAALLRQLGRGVLLETPPIVTSPDGKPVSSSRIRRLVATGHVAEVVPLLGRPHAVTGTVVPGDQRGRALGLPTANVAPPPDAAMPGGGVYAGRALLAGARSAAAINIGHAPTFAAGADEVPPTPSPFSAASPPRRASRPSPRLEAFLLDHDGSDLYGQEIRVEFLERLRDERRFPSPEELVAQIHADIARTRELAAAARVA